MFVSSPRFTGGSYNPTVRYLRDNGVWMRSWAPLMTLVPFQGDEETQDLYLCHIRHVRKPKSGLSPDLDHVGMLISDLPASRTVINKCVLFTSHALYGILVTIASADQDTNSGLYSYVSSFWVSSCRDIPACIS